jgi:hypothetical protein
MKPGQMEGNLMSIVKRASQRRIAIVGLGVLAISLLGSVAPAAAISASRTTLSTSTPSVPANQVAKLKAVVKPVSGTLLPTGNVTFREGSASAPPIGSPVPLTLVNSVQTAKLDLTGLSVGSHTFYATYNGSTDFSPSTSISLTIQVTAVTATPTTTTLTTSTATSASPGTALKFKAVVKQTSGAVKPTGSVTFSDNGVDITPAVALVLAGTVMNAKITISTLSVGTHSIGARYNGSSGFAASTASPAITVTIGKVNSVTTASINALTTENKYTLVAVVKGAMTGSGVPTGNVSFTLTNNTTGITEPSQPGVLGDTGRATVPGLTLNPGNYTLRVNYAGDTKFNASVGSITTNLPAP